MATHSGIFAWEIPWTEEPGRVQFMGYLATKPPPFYLISQGPLVSVSELLQARPRGEEISTET